MNEVTAGVRELATAIMVSRHLTGVLAGHGSQTVTYHFILRRFCVRPYTHLLCPLPMPPSRAFPGWSSPMRSATMS